MPIQAGRSLESYSLNEFKNLAEHSNDNQNLRIRKSNQELTNTPLGFIARYFRGTYARSNSQVTQAFRHALQTDHKYQAVSERLANASIGKPARTGDPCGQERTALRQSKR